ncbi:MAG: rhomboid family intramembrane serine protease, partial [Anaerolineae bacterium]|nr:rhomboid family intramembrane serine protease [Anaerolineae bacterium]
MFPLGDASRRMLNLPLVTFGIIAINIFVFMLELMNGNAFIAQWSLIPANISVGRDWITLLTAMFLHAGWLQIISNIIFLWAFGPQIEDLLGAVQFLIFYLLGGLVATFTQIAIDPMSQSANLGASGAIAAVMGAFWITYPNDRIRMLVPSYTFTRMVLIPAIFLIGVWFLLQVFSALGSITTLDVASGGVAYTAHIGGFLFGLVGVRLFETAARRA